MIIAAHVIIALSSLLYTTYLYVFPSKSRFPPAYVLTALTIGSGTYLVLSKPSHIVSACTTGLIYIGVISFGIVSARHKLSSIENKTN